MQILVLGGTGPVGILIIQKALEKHHTAIVYARSPSKLPSDILFNPRVKVVEGSLTDSDALERAFAVEGGVDAVVSALGPPVLGIHPSGNPLAQGYMKVIEVAKSKGVKRFIVLGTASIKDDEDKNDPVLGADPKRNNNFQYDHPAPFNITEDQSRCPFSAHIRKVKPRDDFRAVNNGDQDTIHHIMRAGIPYGPEVSVNELTTHTTTTERGLAFVSYQSIIQQGFRFQTTQWANLANFVQAKNDTTPGLDPIIGSNGSPRAVSGLDPTRFDRDITFPVQHVISKGGEHFFSPSISAIKSGFA